MLNLDSFDPALLPQIQQNESIAQNYVLKGPVSLRMASIEGWLSCGWLAYQQGGAMERHFSICKWLAIAQHAAQSTDPFQLVQCAHHHSLAGRLHTHPSALVRAACAKWPDIAMYLYQDESPYVRAACTQHEDVAHLLLRDRSHLVLQNIIQRHEGLAFQLTGHPDAMIRAYCAEVWPSSALLFDGESY